MNDAPLIVVEDLRRSFDLSEPWATRVLRGAPPTLLRAVDGVDFVIPRGETFALVGESGCGKSTVARMAAGLMRPTGGRVLFDGVDMAQPGPALRAARRRLNMIFQDPYASLNPRWRVERIIAEPLTDSAAPRKRVDELLRLVGLSPADGRKFPHEFSGGQRQRIGIARALANEPDFIICDEPTSALDVSVQAQILNLMRDLQDAFGLTYLFISHDLAVVRHMARRIGVMYLGALCEVAEADALFDQPRHPYTRALLDAIPSLDGPHDRAAAPAGEPPNPIDQPTGCGFHPRCPNADGRCRTERPAQRTIDSARVACHLA